MWASTLLPQEAGKALHPARLIHLLRTQHQRGSAPASGGDDHHYDFHCHSQQVHRLPSLGGRHKKLSHPLPDLVPLRGLSDHLLPSGSLWVPWDDGRMEKWLESWEG